jgi:hypothetical protein
MLRQMLQEMQQVHWVQARRLVLVLLQHLD